MAKKKKIFPLINTNPFRYDVWKLVDRKVFASDNEWDHPLQIICDIDKTYLETKYESIKEMAKIMLESAVDKKTVEGAREFLRALKFQRKVYHGGVSPPLHFVSSSPPQLRAVLEHKIGMDYLLCSSNSFKDQIYNIKMGKISLLKDQAAYKVASILSLCQNFRGIKYLVLIGDNAENDPYVYTLIKHILTQRISRPESIACLELMGVPTDTAEEIFARLSAPSFDFENLKVMIAIREVRPQKKAGALADDIFWFQDYSDLALTFFHLGYFSHEALTQYFSESLKYSRINADDILSKWHGYQQSRSRSKTQEKGKQHYAYNLLNTHTPETPKLEEFFSAMGGKGKASPRQPPLLLAHDSELTSDLFTSAFRRWMKEHLDELDGEDGEDRENQKNMTSKTPKTQENRNL